MVDVEADEEHPEEEAHGPQYSRLAESHTFLKDATSGGDTL
jgi:hypothetical protein